MLAGVAAALALLFLAFPAHAQEVSAGITGIVTDQSGAVIPGAKISLVEVDRNTSWATQSNESGVFAFPRIPPGAYDVSVEATGFTTIARKGVPLEVNQRARLDFQMEVGAVTEVVEVSGAPPLLQTEKTEVGDVINSKTTTTLPLNGRNFTQLSLLIPGATAPNLGSFTNGQRSSNTGGRPFVNGNREQANNFLLDGVDNNHATSNVQSYTPNLDAIGEFKIITSNPSAEFGNAQGAVINVTLKSGTNDFHGNLFHFLRNDKLNANSWQRNWQGLERVAIRENIFGGTIGGPIARNKLFFFADYTGTRRANPGVASNFNVIPSEFRNGDFSRLLSEEGRQLYDPLSDGNGTGDREAFANNQIPMSLISPVAGQLFSRTELYPQPVNSGLQFNQRNTPNTQLFSDQGDIKIDYKASARDDISGRYSQGRQDIPTTNTFPLRFNPISRRPFFNWVGNWTHTFGPSMVNELRVGMNRLALQDFVGDKGLGNIAEELGIANGNARAPGLLELRFTNGFASNIGDDRLGQWRDNVSINYQVSDNLTIVRGRHQMKTGFQFLRRVADNFFSGNFGTTGFLDYSGQFTEGPNANSADASSGFSEADFFLGMPTRLGLGVQEGDWTHLSSLFGLYFQDDWRVTNSLTLNLGLRWEYTSPFVEKDDNQANFEPFTGRHLIAGRDGASRALYESFYGGYQPRVGFAWTPSGLGGKTVFRGSYSVSSYMEGMGTNLRLPFNPPFRTELSRLYQDELIAPTRTEDGLAGLESPEDPFDGANPRLWDPKVRPAMVQQWNFFIQHQLPSDTVFSVGYVGNKGDHLVNVMEYSQRILQSDGSVAPSPYLSGNPELRDKLSRIFGTETNASSSYNALQTSVRRRLNAGWEFQLAYTYAKTLGNNRGFFGTSGGQAGGLSSRWQNIYDKDAEWGPAFFDLRHNFVYSAVYELPFGRGRKIGGNWHPVMDALLGNWRVGGIVLWRTGFPLTPSARDRSGTNSRGPRADRLADGEGTKDVGPGTTWLDTDAFAQPVRGTFGSSGNGVVRGPGGFNLDASIQKEFPIDEVRRFELRAGLFSLTNTPMYGSPNRNVNSGNFGRVLSAQGAREIQLALKFFF